MRGARRRNRGRGPTGGSRVVPALPRELVHVGAQRVELVVQIVDIEILEPRLAPCAQPWPSSHDHYPPLRSPNAARLTRCASIAQNDQVGLRVPRCLQSTRLRALMPRSIAAVVSLSSSRLSRSMSRKRDLLRLYVHVGGGNFERDRVSRLAKLLRQRTLDEDEHAVEPAVLAQHLAAGLRLS